MSTDRQDPHAYRFAPPPLSDDAVVEIRNFIEHMLDQFDLHYAPQVRRFYEDRAEHNMVRSPPPAAADPPF
jgi:hypothetical protein